MAHLIISDNFYFLLFYCIEKFIDMSPHPKAMFVKWKNSAIANWSKWVQGLNSIAFNISLSLKMPNYFWSNLKKLFLKKDFPKLHYFSRLKEHCKTLNEIVISLNTRAIIDKNECVESILLQQYIYICIL